MKTVNSFLKHVLGALMGVLLIGTNLLASSFQQGATLYQLLTVDLAVQGESFTGTIVEKKEKGYVPLPEGSLVSIQGQIIKSKAGGRVDIPPLPLGECAQSMPIEILYTGGCGDDRSSFPSFIAPAITIIPAGINGVTKIHNASRMIKPGGFFTTNGEGLNRIESSGLRKENGDWIPLQSIGGSSVQQKYLLPSSLPEGSYRFEALGKDGAVYPSPVESIYPNLEMNGPALKKLGQKGKISVRSNIEGTLVLWGGMPQIELLPDKTMRSGVNAEGKKVILIDCKGGEWQEVPFVARMIGQYNVMAEIKTPEEAEYEYETKSECDLLSIVSYYDPTRLSTQVETQLVVEQTNGRSAVGSKVEAIVLYPGGIEMASGISNTAGMATLTTSLPGNWPENLISIAAYRPVGGVWQQEPLFSEHTAAAFLLDTSAGDHIGFHTPDDYDEELAEMYRMHKRQWGNYQGICGTALVEICTLYPKLCEDFKKTEAEIEQWLRKWENKKSGGQPSESNHQQAGALGDLDPEMAEIFRQNKRLRGNYQGLCGTAIYEICRLNPEMCKKLEENERAIEQWLKELDEKNPDGKRKAQNGTSEEEFKPSNDSTVQQQEEGTEVQDDEEMEEENQENPIPEEDRAELKDGAVKRAFDKNDVTALRILEIKLGGASAAVTKIGNEYFITYDHEVVFDPKTGQPVNYWEFNKGKTLSPEEWYVMYLLSLGDSPLNLLARIVESAESLGKAFLDELFKDMKAKGDVSRLLEVKSQHLMLLYITASFDQGAMPQLGDHYRDAEKHMEQSIAAAESGDWMTAIEEWESAKTSMAWLALEVMPGIGGGAGKTGGKVARKAAKPLVEVAEGTTRNLDEVLDALRKAAKSEPNQDIARQMMRRADAAEEIAEKSKKLQRVTDLGKARPANFPVAAKDRASLEEYFGKNNVGSVGNRKPENVLVITDANGKKQVWVQPDYSDYKGAYEAVHGEIPKNLNVNVDHLQSRARAGQQGYGYVRLELVDADVNQAWGRYMEKRTVKAGNQGFVEPSGPASVRHIDQFQWWKFQGISPEKVESWIKGLQK